MEELKIEWRHLEETLKNFADYFIQEARNNLSDNNSNASFNLYNSFEKIIEIGDDWFSVKISLEDYWKYVEEGTGPSHKPDARGQYWPPIKPLINWVSDKNIQPSYPDANGRIPSVEQLPYMIKNKIHNEGTEPHPFFEPAKQDAISRFELSIDLAIAEDVDEYIMGKVNDYINRKFREL